MSYCAALMTVRTMGIAKTNTHLFLGYYFKPFIIIIMGD